MEFVQPGELRDRLVASVLKGEKTATSRLADMFDLEGKTIPRPGDRYELIDSDGAVAGVVEIDEVRIVRLAAVGDDVSSAEGGFSGVEEWRSAHIGGWQSYAEAIRTAKGEPDWELSDDSPVVVRFFHLVELHNQPT